MAVVRASLILANYHLPLNVALGDSRMNLSKFSIITVVFGLYFFLVTYSVAYAPIISNFPEWWFELLGESNFSALLFMHLSHFAALVLASIPVTLLLCHFIKIHVYRIAVIYGALMSANLIKDLYFSHENYAALFSISNIIDVIKFLFTLALVTWIYLHIPSPNKKINKDT